MRFKEDHYGNGTYIGSGGLLALGGGEAANRIYNKISPGEESIYLAADKGGNSIAFDFITNLQSSWDDRIYAMTILGNGKIGMGTEAPKARLHIFGGNDVTLSSENNALTIGDTAAENIAFDNNEIEARNNGAASPLYLQLDGGSVSIGHDAGSSYKLNLPNDSDNTVGRARANAWVTYSDNRIKKNQKEIENALEKLNELKPKSYLQYASGFKNGELVLRGDGKFTYGLIAQEVYPIIPEAVYKPKDDSEDL
jgi:hypothetical protein